MNEKVRLTRSLRSQHQVSSVEKSHSDRCRRRISVVAPQRSRQQVMVVSISKMLACRIQMCCRNRDLLGADIEALVLLAPMFDCLNSVVSAF